MRKMKDSGFDWIGKIPEYWEVKKIKYVTIQRLEKGMFAPEKDYYIGLENIVSRSNVLVKTENACLPAIYDVCKKGDVLFNKLRPYLAKVIISPVDGFCTGELIDFKQFNGCKNFFWYYLLTEQFIEVVNASTYGAKMPRANTDFIVNLPIILPPLAEQKKIAEFLDEKCGEIDSIKADVQRQIELLNDYKKSVITEAVTKGLNPKAKLKDSGIEWIGKIPEHWEVKKLKYLCSTITDGSHFSPETTQEGKPYITVSDVYENTIHYENAAKISEQDFTLLVKNGCRPPKGAVLLAKDGTVGRSAIVVDNDYVVLSSLGILVPEIHNATSSFLKYLLDSKFLQEQMKLAMAGSALRRITISKICKLTGIIPSLSEQQSIADYLDEKCSEIDAVIADKQKQLETLDEYKKSLIFEYVTGKKEVI